MKVFKDGKTVEIKVTGVGGVREELFAATVLLEDLWDRYEDGDIAVFGFDSHRNTLCGRDVEGRKVDLGGVDSANKVTRLGGLLYLDEVL